MRSLNLFEPKFLVTSLLVCGPFILIKIDEKDRVLGPQEPDFAHKTKARCVFSHYGVCTN